MALLLATIGMYGVTSFVVTLRTREMGVRLALGASPTRVALGVLKRAAVVCSIGLTAGAVAALIASRSMTSLLFAVSPLSPSRYFIIAAVLASVTALAAYAPARRASRLDPASVIRVE
jgi:ABC-type antimicrobial peptide transport system permease subunit